MTAPETGTLPIMRTYGNLWPALTSRENLESAYGKARRGKRSPAVLAFAEHWQHHLAILRYDLTTKRYRPRPLTRFILRDPKTRVISVSDFRDRIIHHALVNILQPIFEPTFIHDSYASRKGKGTLPAIERFEEFKRQVTRNNTRRGYALKADIHRYFDTVDRQMLLRIIAKRIRDRDVLWLVKIIIENHHGKAPGKGMPLGNWTSQFFANIYLNELDQFVKHGLGAKHYIRYVDDFVILHESREELERHKLRIGEFLEENLRLRLHPTKCSIAPIKHGIAFLGFRIFPHHKLVTRRNWRKIRRKIGHLLDAYEQNEIEAERVFDVLMGWNAYAAQGSTYRLRQTFKTHIEEELIRMNACRAQMREIDAL